MTPVERARMRRNAAMRQPLRLTMKQLAILREILLIHRDRLEDAVKGFGTMTTWDTNHALRDVLDEVTEARCALKRKHAGPDWNPAGDSECEHLATDAQLDAYREAHPEPEEVPA